MNSMPQTRRSETRSFTESGEFATAIRGLKMDLTIVGGGPFIAEVTGIEFGSISIRRYSESLPLIIHSTDPSARATFGFHTRPGLSLVHDGVQVTSERMVRTGKAQSHFGWSAGPLSWGSISVRTEDIHSFQGKAKEFDLTPPSDDQIITPQPDALASLQRMHATVGSIAKEAPELIENSGAARGLELALMDALVACLDSGKILNQTKAQQRHHAIMQRFYAVMDAERDNPLYVLELAALIGTSVRTLSICCQQHLGMGPKKYLQRRRMYLAYQALRRADPSVTTVTDVATQYGFWQFGRFAGQYKAQFGELPSVTLRRTRGG
jgi:AraC-like DNA-binding protein